MLIRNTALSKTMTHCVAAKILRRYYKLNTYTKQNENRMSSHSSERGLTQFYYFFLLLVPENGEQIQLARNIRENNIIEAIFFYFY